MARCKRVPYLAHLKMGTPPTCKRRSSSSSSSSKQLEDKFAMMSLKPSIEGSTAAKPNKKRTSQPPAAVAASEPLIPSWVLYHYMKRVGTLLKRLEIEKDDLRLQLEVKTLEATIQNTIVSYLKLDNQLPSDWNYDRSAAMTLERIECWERNTIRW